jgi:HAMP domain-containing protein
MNDLFAMNHLGFIAAAYAIGILLPGYFAVAAWVRMAGATRRLAAVDTRRQRRRQGA